jgi:osmotically-inducible protein OsmY
MKTNTQIEEEVHEAMLREPLLRHTEIGVKARDGVVTLTGILESYARKLAAENAVKHVAGVKAIIEEIRVNTDGHDQKTDGQITAEILHALRWNINVPEEKVKLIVEDGWVTLEGLFEFNLQREAVKKVLNHLPGIKGVRNNMKIKSETDDAVEKAEIQKALAGHSLFENDQIKVKVSHQNVTLTGLVQSLLEKDIAEQIAWKAPGVSNVTNELVIQS